MEPRTVPLDHDRRVFAHYKTVTEDFCLAAQHHEDIHFGYWPSHEVDRACTELDRERELPDALRCTMEKARAPADLGDKDLAVDAGCGVGGTTRFLANTYGCHVHGLDYTPALALPSTHKSC